MHGCTSVRFPARSAGQRGLVRREKAGICFPVLSSNRPRIKLALRRPLDLQAHDADGMLPTGPS
jgi:hypothetical protein